ncbi:hypothetical protein [Candidatus Albibeggiatoa sp. nov. NOAA]|uniref:hypothetical protein n=1 Tax=Candidatus Albibeggiatoa sp. nov. NOAA TaxID=3162724 RepID=UPI0033042A6D|nr:hypothetical protein [Thiotrichaceae bacterium]
MQVTLHLDLADDIAKTLLQQSNPEQFAQKLIQAALEPFSVQQPEQKNALQDFLDTKDVEALADLDTDMLSQDRKLDTGRTIEL